MATVAQDERPGTRHSSPGACDGNRIEPYGTIHLLHFQGGRLRGQIRQHDAIVGHEQRTFPIRHALAEIAAVSPEFLSIRRFCDQALVLPIPDIPSLKPGEGFQQVQEFVHTAACIADLVQVFHQHDGAGVRGVSDHLQDAFLRRIHIAPDIRDAPARHAGLVLAQPGGVLLADPAGHGRMIGADAAFIPQ